MSADLTDVVARLRAAGCVWAEDEARLLAEAAGSPAALDELVTRRAAGEPLEHLLGWAELAGVRVLLDPGVFVPRQRTALLVREAVEALTPGAGTHDLEGGRRPVLVDLCCGSGAVATAVLDSLADRALEVHAADLDPAAVACARRNLEPRGASVHLGDLVDALPATLRGRVDVLVANAPYVPTEALATMPAEARLHERRMALEGGADGVQVHRRIAEHAPAWLAPGGRLLIETGRRQATLTAAAMERAGLPTLVVIDDELDATVVVGTAPGRS